MTETAVTRFTSTPEGMRLYQRERLILNVTETICATMKAENVSRTELAKRLGKTKGRISQYLNGEKNLTLRTVADIFTALGKTLVVAEGELFVEKSRPRTTSAGTMTPSLTVAESDAASNALLQGG